MQCNVWYGMAWHGMVCMYVCMYVAHIGCTYTFHFTFTFACQVKSKQFFLGETQLSFFSVILYNLYSSVMCALAKA